MGKALSIKENARESAKKLYQQSGFREGKNSSDTLSLWENYREQAMLWRALALLQIPTTLVALILAIVMWYNSETILNVPAKPLPGFYQAGEIPDAEFIGMSTEFVNLIGTYTPFTARRQFNEAAKYLSDPILSRYSTEMLQTELKAIENTQRTQIYYVDPTKTEIFRDEINGTVEVYYEGTRQKLIAGRHVPEVLTQFIIRMKTIPRNTLNEYGIVVYSVETTSTKH